MDKARSEELALKVMYVVLSQKENPTSELRQAMIMQLNKRLNECTLKLNDGKLLAEKYQSIRIKDSKVESSRTS